MKLGTKAKTLKEVSPYLTYSKIPFFIIFDQSEVSNNLYNVLDKVLINFRNKDIIIRSSSEYEDTENESKAGYYLSIPLKGNYSKKKLSDSICSVANSMGESGDNQIIVQNYVPDIALSGVIMTREFQKMNIPRLPVFTTEEGIKRIKEFFGKLNDWKNINDLLPENFLKSSNFKRTGKAGIFAGSLELAKEGNISIKQTNLFDDIFIKEKK